jgi:hypothetical protein
MRKALPLGMWLHNTTTAPVHLQEDEVLPRRLLNDDRPLLAALD